IHLSVNLFCQTHFTDFSYAGEAALWLLPLYFANDYFTIRAKSVFHGVLGGAKKHQAELNDTRSCQHTIKNSCPALL
ncbi:MAG: hypothetical protein LBT22_07280, partial [Peptococcaceae bacterium]|nr:hypothetical protein [Peptococcaceae bacterium]